MVPAAKAGSMINIKRIADIARKEHFFIVYALSKRVGFQGCPCLCGTPVKYHIHI
jgi:hypothetical protein